MKKFRSRKIKSFQRTENVLKNKLNSQIRIEVDLQILEVNIEISDIEVNKKL